MDVGDMKQKELLDLIEQQANLIDFNKSLLGDLGMFYDKGLSRNELDVIECNMFFKKVEYLLEREIILNYSSLFSNNENDFFRLPKTIDAIIQKFKKLSWIDSVALDVIKDYARKIDSVIHSNTIKTIRDKAIAHRESNWKTKIPDFDYQSLQELNTLCAEINDKIFRNLSKKVPLSNWNLSWDMGMDNIVKNLAEGIDIREKYYNGGSQGGR
jgi:hypothetical protein